MLIACTERTTQWTVAETVCYHLFSVKAWFGRDRQSEDFPLCECAVAVGVSSTCCELQAAEALLA